MRSSFSMWSLMDTGIGLVLKGNRDLRGMLMIATLVKLTVRIVT